MVRNENRGFAHGNNRGFETADAPFVLFLNPDTEIRTGTFETLLSYLREHPSVGLLGCRQLSGGGDLCHTIRRFPSPLRYLLEALGSDGFRSAPRGWASASSIVGHMSGRPNATGLRGHSCWRGVPPWPMQA